MKKMCSINYQVHDMFIYCKVRECLTCRVSLGFLSEKTRLVVCEVLKNEVERVVPVTFECTTDTTYDARCDLRFKDSDLTEIKLTSVQNEFSRANIIEIPTENVTRASIVHYLGHCLGLSDLPGDCTVCTDPSRALTVTTGPFEDSIMRNHIPLKMYLNPGEYNLCDTFSEYDIRTLQRLYGQRERKKDVFTATEHPFYTV